MNRRTAAKELLRLADALTAAPEAEAVDPNFVQKIRELRSVAPLLTSKKRRTLHQVGISTPIKPTETVESLVDTLLSIARG